ncbi:MAG: hypothetical protein ABI083_15505 [Lapillicoccus sp.]
MSRIAEDEVKEAVRAHLAAEGFDIAVAWGHVPGIDIAARHPDCRRYVIEAKAEVRRTGAHRVNYFLPMLGELCHRMDDPEEPLIQWAYGHVDQLDSAMIWRRFGGSAGYDGQGPKH